MFRAVLAFLLMFPILALAKPSAPPDFPRLSVQEPVLYKACGTTASGVTIAVDPALECPVDVELDAFLLVMEKEVVKVAAKQQEIEPELFSGAVVVFVPAVLTKCSSDPADDNDYAGCTEAETKFSMVSTLSGDPLGVAVHELEHTAIHLREKAKLFYSKKREDKMHNKLDADRLEALQKRSTGD